MGSIISTDEIIDRVTIEMTEMRIRISRLETHVCSLQKNVMDIQLSDRVADDRLSTLDDHMFNLNLLEEGRSVYSKNRFHTRSEYQR